MPTLEEEQINIDYSEDVSALKLDISCIRTLLETQLTLNNPEDQTITVVQLDETTQKMLDEMRIHTQNSENWLIATCIGVGLVFGIICTLILSNFVRH